jgi:hypothetical protein
LTFIVRITIYNVPVMDKRELEIGVFGGKKEPKVRI